jgi:hypothetical protein
MEESGKKLKAEMVLEHIVDLKNATAFWVQSAVPHYYGW